MVNKILFIIIFIFRFIDHVCPQFKDGITFLSQISVYFSNYFLDLTAVCYAPRLIHLTPLRIARTSIIVKVDDLQCSKFQCYQLIPFQHTNCEFSYLNLPLNPFFHREIGGEITQDGDFFIFESNRYRHGFLYKNISMSGVVSDQIP